MELMISQKIQQYRKHLGMTQEDLAAVLDVSPQAVSNWERGTCYPDITILPGLANLFGITIDELMDNNETGRKADWERYRKSYRECKTDEEVFRLTLAYYRKYPTEPLYMCHLSGSLTAIMIDNAEQRKLYFPLLREISEKMLGDISSRDIALRNMTAVCDEEELPKWLSQSPLHTRRENLKFRYMLQGKHAEYRMEKAVETLECTAKVFDLRTEDSIGSSRKADFHYTLLGMMDTLRTGGKLPDGWILFYAYKELILSACLAASGFCENHPAWDMFERALEHFRYWFALKDEFLDLGKFGLFDELKVSKDWKYVQSADGTVRPIYSTVSMSCYTPQKLYALLTDASPRTAWFDPLRNDPRFRESLEQIKQFL